MSNPSVQLDQEPNMAQSRILFEEVMIDNEPTQQQVLQRAEQLQIDDLSLARQSLTKELQPFWRPYMNRFGDIYYINLKDRKAYIDHPIDMETKVLYAKRHKTLIPKFKAYELQDVSGSIYLINEEINNIKKAELFRSTQSIPTELKIVYEQSEQSHTQRQLSSQNQYSDESSDQEYIENLQKSQEENTRSRRSTPRQQRQSFNRGYKKFPSGNNRESANQFVSDQPQMQLTPQYERLLIECEQELKKQHQKELHSYRECKHSNYLKKQQLSRQSLKAQIDQHKFTVLAQFQTQLQEKNYHKFEKETHKIAIDYKQKLQAFQTTLQKEKLILQKLEKSAQQKHDFIHSLEQKMQLRISQGKYLMHEQINQKLYQTHFLSQISQANANAKQQFSKDSYKAIESKLNETIRQKGIKSKRGQKLQASSLTSFYENIVKKQFEKIDRLLLENQVGRQVRKRTKSIFNKKKTGPEQSHIVFIDLSRQILQKEKSNKQNNLNAQNIKLQQKKHDIVKKIQSDILKSTQANGIYYQRRSKIFSENYSMQPPINKSNKKTMQTKVIIPNLQQSIPQLSYCKPDSICHGRDRKSMYLRMMKRVL